VYLLKMYLVGIFSRSTCIRTRHTCGQKSPGITTFTYNQIRQSWLYKPINKLI
jgi:hypothetical protein